VKTSGLSKIEVARSSAPIPLGLFFLTHDLIPKHTRAEDSLLAQALLVDSRLSLNCTVI
jgi:hypothetical protein